MSHCRQPVSDTGVAASLLGPCNREGLCYRERDSRKFGARRIKCSVPARVRSHRSGAGTVEALTVGYFRRFEPVCISQNMDFCGRCGEIAVTGAEKVNERDT